MKDNNHFVVLISANAEWRVVRKYFPLSRIYNSPYGKWFIHSYKILPNIEEKVIFIHGGWGKVAAAGSTQFLITKWHPKLVINLGTCGGFEGKINKGEIILAEKTIIYDIYEQMGDQNEHIQYYSTEIDTSWIRTSFPIPVVRSLLISGDRDLLFSDIPEVEAKFNAKVGDWESGAIAWVAKKNNTKCVILRGVTDLISTMGGEAYQGNIAVFYENTEKIMLYLLDYLPQLLLFYIQSNQGN